MNQPTKVILLVLGGITGLFYLLCVIPSCFMGMLNPSSVIESFERAEQDRIAREAREAEEEKERAIEEEKKEAERKIADAEWEKRRAAERAEEERLNRPGLTMHNFNRIKTGMKLKEVQAILGPGGKLTTSMKVGWSEAEVYDWERHYGSKYILVSITFDDGEVTSKFQSGL